MPNFIILFINKR